MEVVKMKTILKRIFLGTLVLSLCMQNVSAFSYDFSRLSLSRVATSLWNTVSEHPKTVLGVIGATLGLAAVYKYFSHKNVIKSEAQPQIHVEEHSVSAEEQAEESPEILEEPSAFEQLSDIDEMHQKYNKLLGYFEGDGKVILENLNTRLEKYANNGEINSIASARGILRESKQAFDSDFGPFKDQARLLTLDTVLQQQDNDFAGILWRNHPMFNDAKLVEFYGGYWFFHLGEGKNNGASLKKDPMDREKLVQNYKIHLMPRGRDVNKIISVLLREFVVELQT